MTTHNDVEPATSKCGAPIAAQNDIMTPCTALVAEPPRCESLDKFITFIRNESDLPSKPREARIDTMIQYIEDAGLDVSHKDDSDLYSISASRCANIPSPQWRMLANTIIRFDNDNLPTLVACGPQELYPADPEELRLALDEAVTGNYRIEPILFGTVCWLYHDGSKWRLATKRTADAFDTCTRQGGPTIRSAFDEAIMRIYSQSSDAFISNLRPHLTYGFVLYHHRLHIFSYPDFEMKIWRISTLVSNSGAVAAHNIAIEASPSKRETLGTPPAIYQSFLQVGSDNLPKIVSIVSEETSQRLIADGYEPGKVPLMIRRLTPTPSIMSMDIMRRARMPLVEICYESSMSLQSFDASRHTMLGFVMRSVGGSNARCSIIVKSPLYTFIERYIGKTIPINAIVAQMLFEPINEVRSFHNLFPTLSTRYTKALTIIDELAVAICDYHMTTITAAIGGAYAGCRYCDMATLMILRNVALRTAGQSGASHFENSMSSATRLESRASSASRLESSASIDGEPQMRCLGTSDAELSKCAALEWEKVKTTLVGPYSGVKDRIIDIMLRNL